MILYDKNKNQSVFIGDIPRLYNVSKTSEHQYVGEDVIELLGLVPLIIEKPIVSDTQVCEEDVIVYDEALNTATQTYRVVELYEDDIDENGNIIKTKQQKHEENLALLEQEQISQINIQETLEINNKWSEVRGMRKLLLENSDKYVLPDFPHASEEERTLWLEYRQTLRDITEGVNDPRSIVFPATPTL
jgi:predicted XRE-type DNA-binding protein